MMNLPTILLLDEDDMMREATAMLLGNRGANVTKTASIDEAISQLERQAYDVAIIDVQMTSPHGAQTLDKLAENVSAPTRIVVCTDQPLGQPTTNPISDVLVKPYPFERLLTAVFGRRLQAPDRHARTSQSSPRRNKTLRRSARTVRHGRA